MGAVFPCFCNLPASAAIFLAASCQLQPQKLQSKAWSCSDWRRAAASAVQMASLPQDMPDSVVQELASLSADELRQLLEDWSLKLAVSYERKTHFLDMFAQRDCMIANNPLTDPGLFQSPTLTIFYRKATLQTKSLISRVSPKATIQLTYDLYMTLLKQRLDTETWAKKRSIPELCRNPPEGEELAEKTKDGWESTEFCSFFSRGYNSHTLGYAGIYLYMWLLMHMLLFMVVVGCPSFVMTCLGKCYEGNSGPVLTHEWGYTVTNQICILLGSNILFLL